MKKTAVIIGAGPAGLTAAYYLLKETDIEPLIVEESGEIGGISRTVEYHGNRMDLGGHRFFSKNDEVMKLWTTLMPVQGSPSRDDLLLDRPSSLNEGGPDPESSDEVTLVRTRVSRIYYLRKFFDYPISLKWETLANLGLLRTMRAGFGYVWAMIFKRKEQNLKDFMINRFGVPLYRMFFEDYTEKVWGENPKDISASWGAQRIKGLSLSKAIGEMLRKAFGRGKKMTDKDVETSLIEQFIYPKKGPGQLWEKMASEVERMGGRILLNHKVTKLHTDGSRITAVEVAGQANQTITGDYFFSSMPIKDLVEAFDTEVPKNVYDIAVNLPYRDFITVGLLVDKMNIQNKTSRKTVNNIVPDCWIYIQERDVKMGRLQIFNNWSPYMVKDWKNTVWIGLEYFCNEGDEMWNMPDREFIDFAVGELVKMGIIDADAVRDAHRINVKKAYPAYFGTYESFDTVKDYLNSFDNLYCIGRNGQHRYNNMDHSMLSAMEAVRVVKTSNPSKESIWQVNTEQNYHETKEGGE